MPAVACENISCGSPPYLLNPVPPNEKPSCLNQYRPHVVSWDPPSSQSTQLHSSCGGPSHYVGTRNSWQVSFLPEGRVFFKHWVRRSRIFGGYVHESTPGL